MGAEARSQQGQLGRQLRELRAYVERHLRARALAEGVNPERLASDDVVHEAFLGALRRRPPGERRLPSPNELRNLARGVIGREVARWRAIEGREVSLDTPVVPAQPIALAGIHPDEQYTLADMLTDPNAPLPAEVVEQEELTDVLEAAFAELPKAWREVFYMRYVDGLSEQAVADLWRVPVETVVHGLEQTRAYLRERLLTVYGAEPEAA